MVTPAQEAISKQSNLPAEESNHQLEKTPRGLGSFTSKGHFYPKTKFQEEVNYSKNRYLNECSKTHRTGMQIISVRFFMLSFLKIILVFSQLIHQIRHS